MESPRSPGSLCFGWLQKPWVTGDSGDPVFGILLEQGVSEESPNSTGTPGSRNHPKMLFPGVSGKFEFPKSPPTAVVPGDSGNPEFRLIPGPGRSWWFRDPRITSDSGNLDFRFTMGTRSFWWLRETGVADVFVNRKFLWLRESGVPGDLGNPWWLRESVVPGESGNPLLGVSVSPETRSSWQLWIWEPGVTEKSGLPNHPVLRDPGVRATPGTRSSCRIRHPEISFECGIPDFRVTTGTWSSGLLRQHAVPGDSGKPEFQTLPWHQISVDSWNP